MEDEKELKNFVIGFSLLEIDGVCQSRTINQYFVLEAESRDEALGRALTKCKHENNKSYIENYSVIEIKKEPNGQ